MDRTRKIENGHIVVKNLLYQELSKHEVIVQSGRTLYRFTGSFDGKQTLTGKILRLMEKALAPDEKER